MRALLYIAVASSVALVAGAVAASRATLDDVLAFWDWLGR